MLIILCFTPVTQLEDIKFDDLPDYQRRREVQFCCLTAGVRLPITDPGLFMDPVLGNHIAEIRIVESGEPEAHVVVRSCGDFVSQNFVMFSPYL